MLNPMTESNDTIYLKKSTIDRSVGYLVGGIVALMFFFLTVLGMGRIQTISDETTTSNRFEPEQKSADIGGASTDTASP